MIKALEFSCHGKTFVHTTGQWRVACNRHTSTSGNSWGWIEGPNANVTWSNDYGSGFTSEDAGEAVRIHNNWLNAQTPPLIRLAKLEHERSALAIVIERLETQLKTHRVKLERINADMGDALSDSKRQEK